MKNIFSGLLRNFRKDPSAYRFGLFVAFLFIVIFVFENINHRFWLTDFRVYYDAAKAMISGKPVYFVVFDQGSGIYKYSPVILFFFLPYCIFSYKVAAILHFAVLSFIIGYAFVVIRKILTEHLFSGKVRNEGLLMSFAFICILIHVVKELHLGNINSVLLLLCCLALRSFLAKRNFTGGILFGIILLTKPFFLILGLPLLLRRNLKSLAGAAGTLVAGFILPLLILGISRGSALHAEWMKTLFFHQESYASVNNLFYILQHLFFPSIPDYFRFVIIALTGLAVSGFVTSNLRTEKKHINIPGMTSGNFIIEWFLLIALIPDLVNTDSEHFLASAPVITFLIYTIQVKRQYWFIPLLIILIFFYGANSNDLLGDDLSNKLYALGLIGISNLFLVLSAFLFYLDLRRETIISTNG